MSFRIWLTLSSLTILLSATKSSNYLHPDVLTHHSEEPNWIKPPHDRIVMCGVNAWREYSVEEDILNLNLTQCTHAVYRSVYYSKKDKLVNWRRQQANQNGISTEYEDYAFATILNFRKRFPHLRVLIEISVEGMPQSYMFSNRKDRLAMKRTAISFINKYKFDGIVILYKMPRKLPEDYLKRSDDMFDFIKIMYEQLWKNELVLALRVFNYRHRIMTAFKFGRIIEYLDFFEIHMGYNDNKIKSYVPLYGIDKHDEYCLDYQIRTLMLLGIPMNRVLISFRSGAFSYSTHGERTIQIGVSIPASRRDILNMSDVCREVDDKGTYKFYWDGVGHSPYAYSYEENKVLLYDTPRSLIQKIRFAMKFDVRGFYLSTINFDDLNGECVSRLYTDKYQDIEYDFEDLKNNADIAKVLPLLNLPNNRILKSRHQKWPQMYRKSDKSLNLFIPEDKNEKQTLLYSVTAGIMYAQQELAVEEALSKKKTPQGTRMLTQDEVWQIFSKG